MLLLGLSVLYIHICIQIFVISVNIVSVTIHTIYNGQFTNPMMTSSSGNIFRVTGPLCGEFTGPGEFPTQRPVTRSFDVFFDLRLNKRLSKQPWGWWFETPSWSLWRHCNGLSTAWLLRVKFINRIFTDPSNYTNSMSCCVSDIYFLIGRLHSKYIVHDRFLVYWLRIVNTDHTNPPRVLI